MALPVRPVIMRKFNLSLLLLYVLRKDCFEGYLFNSIIFTASRFFTSLSHSDIILYASVFTFLYILF